MILSGSVESALAMLGLECSTFVSINKGTHKRDELMPWGDMNMPSVMDANMGTSRPQDVRLNFRDITFKLPCN